MLLQHSTQEPQRGKSSWLDEKNSENTRDGQISMKQLDADSMVVSGERGDPVVEEALFTESLRTLIAVTLAYRLNHVAPKLPSAKSTSVGNENKSDGRAGEDSSRPKSLSISALAPAQMAALIAGLPGGETLANGGNVDSVSPVNAHSLGKVIQ